jgi:CheY-like chemotaxis protein
MGHVFMDAYLLWMLVGSIACALVGGLGYRAWRRMQAKRRSERAAVEAAAWAEAQCRAAAKAARHRHRHELAAQEAVRAEAAKRAEVDAALAQAKRLAAAEAAHAQAEAARAEAANLADAEVARVQAARAAAEAAALEQAARLEIERQATALAAAQSAATLVAKTPAQTLVMVADDSKVVRVKIGRLLALHQYRVTFATDGLDAVNQMRTSMPDVVITDVDMPGMDGFELTRHVRQNPLTAHIPVIMITAADDKHRQDADGAGVSVLLGKPYPEDELIAHIRQAMKHDELAAAATA